MQSLRLAMWVLGCVLFVTTSSPAIAQTPQRGRCAVAHGDTAATLKQDTRKLWTDHVVWTRDYIICGRW
jgi:hypothetical protein